MSDDLQLRNYLLGTLPEEEREAVEQRLFTDTSFFALAEAMEAELMDSYAAGELRKSERAQWEAYMAAHPRTPERLLLAKGLQRRFGARRRWWLPALAAVAAMLCVCVYLLMRPTGQAPQPLVIAVTLTAGGVRSATEQPQVIRLPEGNATLRIRWNQGGVSASIRHIDSGRTVWTGPVQAGASDLPAPALAPGDYVATTKNEAGEETADYSFRVERSAR